MTPIDVPNRRAPKLLAQVDTARPFAGGRSTLPLSGRSLGLAVEEAVFDTRAALAKHIRICNNRNSFRPEEIAAPVLPKPARVTGLRPNWPHVVDTTDIFVAKDGPICITDMNAGSALSNWTISEMDAAIRHEVGLFSHANAVRWSYHTALMFGIWFGHVPFARRITRFFKLGPRSFGLGRSPASGEPFEPIRAPFHDWGFSAAMTTSLEGASLALMLSGGFSGALHVWFGLGTVLSVAPQIVAPWRRGMPCGRWGRQADTVTPAVWHGDHHDVAPGRRWSEAYHKTGGHFPLFLAVVPVTSGQAQYWLPGIALAFVLMLATGLALVVLFEALGRRHDIIRAVYGNHPDHAWNKARGALTPCRKRRRTRCF
ncbi:MAG: hypothetical protein H6895_03625 [Defluviimonas sp.]|uniref:hypothetical protein n=1 Tax=Albidovulum sp. TaxID=1872424 RepID=UPI002A320789|nr:hypothetical protein [Defluviimonas sp.]